ncbi:MAG TPA: DNA cytosine methyltransferase [Candidatus Baltobacteraceae bacterium]|jgi:DNA (cytosine-5)-methyltransferase 1|nr:DNA cytosine methyltransferase [Candidatus Baltobacteraceae bacterium]
MKVPSNATGLSLLGDRAEADRIIEQAVRSCQTTRGNGSYDPRDAERVYFRMTRRPGHPRSIGRALTQIARRFCKEAEISCAACPIRQFCETGRSNSNEHPAVPFIDLFCGAGGFSLGFEALGFTPALSIDHDPSAVRTYNFNRLTSGGHGILADIEDVAYDTSLRGLAPLIIGGPPCQPFSMANRQRAASDQRDRLIDVFLHATMTSQAKVFVIENVAGVRQREEVIKSFGERVGYVIFQREINASDVGVPQNRNRTFIFGVKAKTCAQHSEVEATFLRLLSEQRLLLKTALRDAIRDLPALRAPYQSNATVADSETVGFAVAPFHGGTLSQYTEMLNGGKNPQFLFNHRAKYLNGRDREIYRLLRPGEKSDADSIAHIMPYKHRAHLFRDKFYRLKWTDVSKTITAHMYYDCHMYIHPTQARGLTPREAARIQGFPDSYFFVGRPNEWYRQIGNAVSPIVAGEVARIAHGLLALFGETDR